MAARLQRLIILARGDRYLWLLVTSVSNPKPKGWWIAVGVVCITLGVVAGLIAIAVIAKRKQRYRITEPAAASPALHRPAVASDRPPAPRWPKWSA